MKKAIGYVRISSKDQSNWSLEGQENDIRSYCLRNNIELSAVFIDDGESAKNFDRASWRNLEKFVKAHHKEIDTLAVMAYDRFSRNVSEALGMIEKLEKSFNILVISVTQPIPLHADSPYYFMFRTNMLVNAELELRVIRDRARTGINRASKEGRFCRKAPIGYLNSRDERNKPILIKDEKTEGFVRAIFSLYLQGYSFYSIEIALIKAGMSIKSNGRIQRILSNPIYAGFISVAAYYDEPSKLVKGLQAPIIDERDWWKVQDMMKKPGKKKSTVSNELPLRGVLYCHQCGKALTGAASKGKYNYYHYYWCVSHRKDNFNASKLHTQMEAIIGELSLSPTALDYLKATAHRFMEQTMTENQLETTQAARELKDVEKKLSSLEEKYLFEGLDRDTYNKYKLPLESQKANLQEAMDDLNGSTAEKWGLFAAHADKLGNLPHYWHTANTEGKHAFLRLVFDNKLSYYNGVYRTPIILPMFASKALILKEKRLIEIEQPLGKNVGNYPVCASRYHTRTLLLLINWCLAQPA